MTSDQLKELYSLCSQIAASPDLTRQLISEIEGSLAPSLLARIRSCLDRLQLLDLGVTEDTIKSLFEPGMVTYMLLHERPELCLCVFGLGRGTGLPLHDHPGMLAMTKVLQGRLKFKFADLTKRERDNVFSYQVVSVGEVSAPGVLALTPAMSNLHQFVAMENTVMLDVFMPNYSPIRDVTYFLEISENQVYGLKSALLQFREVPFQGCVEGFSPHRDVVTK